MIQHYYGIKEAVENAVHKAYQSLSEYAASSKANPAAVAVRRKMLDIFTDGWNSAEALIAAYEHQIEILQAKVKMQRLPYRGKLNRPVTVYDCAVLLTQSLNENRTLKDLQKIDHTKFKETDWRKESPHSISREHKRATHLKEVQEKWADHF